MYPNSYSLIHILNSSKHVSSFFHLISVVILYFILTIHVLQSTRLTIHPGSPSATPRSARCGCRPQPQLARPLLLSHAPTCSSRHRSSASRDLRPPLKRARPEQDGVPQTTPQPYRYSGGGTVRRFRPHHRRKRRLKRP